ncbi:ABC transporter ATP-binding protein [bacterium]|nr:ABC transporter ATP-binding protein [bacterium]
MAETKSNVAIAAKDLVKIYQTGETQVKALNGVSLEISEGEMIAITGPSGSGKSTLMHLIGCLDIPTSGEYFIGKQNVAKMSRDELAEIRNKRIGFVFQKFHLLPDIPAVDNVALPLLYAGIDEDIAKKKARAALRQVELGDRMDHYPYQMSGGQQQRVAVARSIINNPTILLADEPTGNLDTETGNSILDLFKKLNSEQNATIILVTHEPDVAQRAKRIIELVDGKIHFDQPVR